VCTFLGPGLVFSDGPEGAAKSHGLNVTEKRAPHAGGVVKASRVGSEAKGDAKVLEQRAAGQHTSAPSRACGLLGSHEDVAPRTLSKDGRDQRRRMRKRHSQEQSDPERSPKPVDPLLPATFLPESLDLRPRREILADLLSWNQVDAESPSETRLQVFRTKHGRCPRFREGKALGIGDDVPRDIEAYDPCPPYWEGWTWDVPSRDGPRSYLEDVRDALSAPEHSGYFSRERLEWLKSENDPRIVDLFKRKLNAAKGRRNGALLSKDPLLCALLALGVPSDVAHDWLKGAPKEDPRLNGVADFVDECCRLPGHGPLRDHCRITSAALYGAYRKWCEARNAEPYGFREFSVEILQCGGVKKWRTAKARGFVGVALR